MKSNDISIKEIIRKHARWPKIRRDNGIRAEDLAKDVGISMKQYLLWEKGLLMEHLEKNLEKFRKVEEALENRAIERKGK